MTVASTGTISDGVEAKISNGKRYMTRDDDRAAQVRLLEDQANSSLLTVFWGGLSDFVVTAGLCGRLLASDASLQEFSRLLVEFVPQGE